MKKPPRKLELRTETVRTLASMELVHVVGGDDAVLSDTGAKMCPAPAALGPADPTPRA